MTMTRSLTALLALAISVGVGALNAAPQPTGRRGVADLVAELTRESKWALTSKVPVAFPTFHPQGMVRIGDTFFVSSVEVTQPTRRFPGPINGYDRDTGAGVGHLFKFDASGKLLADLILGEKTIYHPGGIDYDGTDIWVPVAEYRPNSKSIVYRVDPQAMKATEVFRWADHIGGVVHDIEDGTLHGVSWGSRRFYRWKLDVHRRPANVVTRGKPQFTMNPSHYVDYQDCKYVGQHRMVCTGLAELRPGPGAAPFRLGGLDLIDLRDGRPIHQVPVPLWTSSGLDMTHNPTWFEVAGGSLRAYFMPEDNTSTIYVYDVENK
jgi:hypothetical protein